MSMRQSLRDWIRHNRPFIDAHVASVGGPPRRLSDTERHEWVLNDEYLYRLARAAGVRV